MLTGFVVQSLWQATGKQGQLAHGEPTLDIDNAELVLKLDTAVDYIQGQLIEKVPSGPGLPGGKKLDGKQLSKFDKTDFKADALQILQKKLDKSPDSILLESKVIIVIGESAGSGSKQLSEMVARLKAFKGSQEKQLGRALEAIYIERVVPRQNAAVYAAALSKILGPGWYRDSSLVRLYRLSGQTKQAQALQLQLLEHSSALVINVLLLMSMAVVAGLFGLLVILIQLFTLPRKLGKPEDEAGGSEAPLWSGIQVYGIFVGWLATQLLVSAACHQVIKVTGVMSHGALAVSLNTTAIYLACNLPSLFYIYYFACRPYKVNMRQALWLKFKSGNNGPFRLIAIGFCTWCAALPIVAGASYLAMKYLGAQGSANPVLTLVLDAARYPDIRATAVFYLTLGVLAPICEEALFRGFLYRSLRKRLGVGTSLLASAAAFAAVHLDSGAVVQLFCLGWVFGFVFERTRSLIPSMVAHGLWNSGTFTLVMMLLAS